MVYFIFPSSGQREEGCGHKVVNSLVFAVYLYIVVMAAGELRL